MEKRAFKVVVLLWVARQGCRAAAKAGTDISEATKEAVTGAIEAGDEIGTQVSKAVRDALATSIKGAKDVIKPPPK